MKTSPIFIRSAMLVLAMGVVAGCRRDDSQAGFGTKPKAVLVQVVEMKPHPLQSTVEVVGTIEPKVSAKIIATLDGAIEELYVRENDHVRKNQVVGVLSSTDRLALLGETQARLERIQSKSNTTPHANLDKGAGTELQRATEDREYAQRLFLGTPIVSPIRGRVIDKPIEVGSVVSARQLLLTVADLDRLIIRTAVSELLFPGLRVGQKLAVRLDAFPGRQFNGIISLVSPQVNPATRTGEIEVRVADAAGSLKPGMLATLTIVTERRESAMAIPGDAIIATADGQNVVFVAQDTVARRRVVTLGMITKTETEIRNGLQRGDRVVVMGQELLKEGIPVKIQEPRKMPGNTPPREGAQ
jgi:RND family efflux transporter MFP subunit